MSPGLPPVIFFLSSRLTAPHLAQVKRDTPASRAKLPVDWGIVDVNGTNTLLIESRNVARLIAQGLCYVGTLPFYLIRFRDRSPLVTLSVVVSPSDTRAFFCAAITILACLALSPQCERRPPLASAIFLCKRISMTSDYLRAIHHSRILIGAGLEGEGNVLELMMMPKNIMQEFQVCVCMRRERGGRLMSGL